MQVRRVDAQTVSVGPLDVFAAELLQQIPLTARDESDAAQDRLYPSPSEEREPEFDEDWKDYVTPDLRRLFATSLETIESDLEGFPPGDAPAEARILHLPVAHLEAWIHGLNQARLAMAARHGFDQIDIEAGLPFEDGERALALVRIHLYGFLQECFLLELGDG